MNWYAYEPKEEPEPVVIDSQTAHKLQELINDADEEYRKSSRSEQNRPADTPALKKLHTFLGELRNDPSASPDAGLEPDKATEPQTGKDTNNKPLRNLLDNR